jgi:spore photoproduct lyase
MQKVRKVTRKSMEIKPSGRSSDFISPSFGFSCLLNCSYCYCKRHSNNGLTIAKNVGQILTVINNHSYFTTIDKPNQTDVKFITYDISCSEDFALHRKYHPWKKIFEFFRDHEIAKATLATKIVPTEFLEFNPNGKVRIRFSLMPQNMSFILEPNTALIIDRIKAINTFIEAGYDIHVNFSPVVVYQDWLDDYRELFELLNQHVDDKYKNQVLAEVIFLTHNKKKHEYNLEHKLPGENYLWTPRIQEDKTSQYGGLNIRYKSYLKKQYIADFTKLHDEIIPWNTIRYIF